MRRRRPRGRFLLWGLTGGIGMGKSTVAGAFRRAHVPVFDADAAVHALQGPGGRAVRPIGAAFPGSVADGRVDREALRQAVMGRPEEIRRLEAIVHPLVRDAEARFLAAARRRGDRLAVLDVPLLFESGRAPRCDAVIVVSAPPAVQRRRVVGRRGMTAERFAFILSRQMPDAEKRRRADHVIRTGLSRFASQAAVKRLLKGVFG